MAVIDLVFGFGCQVEVDKISQLVGVIKELLSESEDEVGLPEVKQFFRLTCEYITEIANGDKEALPEVSAQFKSIENV